MYMEEQTTTPEEKVNKIGKIQVTRVWLTPELESEIIEFHKNHQFFSNVQIVQAPDGSYTFIMKTNVAQTANRALLHYFVAFAESQLRKQKNTK